MNQQIKIVVEEIANAATHGIGAALSLTALLVMVYTVAKYHLDSWHLASVLVYGFSLIVLYMMSTLYHSLFKLPKASYVFKILDHSAIYILIAGTYTPFLWITLRGTSGPFFSILIWLLAGAGIVWQCFNVHRYRKVATLCYIAMGWIAIFLVPELLEKLPGHAIAWLLAGGISYTAGTVFYLWRSLPFQHAIWHLFVLAGSAAHFYCIYYYVVLSAPV